MTDSSAENIKEPGATCSTRKQESTQNTTKQSPNNRQVWSQWTQRQAKELPGAGWEIQAVQYIK